MELFDTHGRINFPTEAQVAELPAHAQERFKPVREAKAALDAITRHKEAIVKRIEANDIERGQTKEAIDTLRPKWDATMNAKAHIASEQRQRRLERGLE
jgi:hypothetical protein